MTQYLQYWKLPQAEREIAKGEPLEHSAGEQLKRVQVGDVVWIITIESGKLILIGRMQVGERLHLMEAKRRFGADVWAAKHHIVAEPGTEEDLRKLNITHLASQLRFESPTGKDRLYIKNRRVDGKQFQALRKLTSQSVALLEECWFKVKAYDFPEIERRMSTGAGFGSAETNKKVETSAIKFVTGQYKKDGWAVMSVEADKCGFDLLCRKNGEEEHVEVKGIAGNTVSFIITANEVKQAKNNSKFVICAVTSALDKNPKLNRFSGNDFIKKFRLEEIAYKAILNGSKFQ